MNTTNVGVCLYNCYYFGKGSIEHRLTYSKLPDNISDLNGAMCGIYNRMGTLCGKCAIGAYLFAYSYDMSCTDCEGGWYNCIKYIVIAYVPLTVFYMVVLLFKINIPSSHLQGFVLFSQIISSPIIAHDISLYLRRKTDTILYKGVQIFGTFYGIWNLDFFRLSELNICFQISPLTVLSLDAFVAIYPLLLMTITYKVTCLHDSNNKAVVILLRPFKAAFKCFKNNLDIKTSTVDSFATFMFLSNMKFLNVGFDLLLPIQVCDTSSNSTDLQVGSIL